MELTEMAVEERTDRGLDAADCAASLGSANAALRALQVEASELRATIDGMQVAEADLRRRNEELEQLNERLAKAHAQLIQSEKLASIGQLAAGVAHEINNPIGFILSNFSTLEDYVGRLFEMLAAYERAESALAGTPFADEIRSVRERVELDYLKEDIPALMLESREGTTRVRKIVQDLKDFSRADSNRDWVSCDIHRGLDSTLNIVANEVKYKADVERSYGELPQIECLPSELNQVFLNLLVNAAQAMDKSRGTIRIRTGCDDGRSVWVEVEDDGAGIAAEHLPRIFDPFFTTKAVGKGTGLGLSLSYGIVQKHHGRIEVESELGKGTRFRITLPVHQPADDESAVPEETVQ
jgi:two-component system, NtrC family, sensor kinase